MTVGLVDFDSNVGRVLVFLNTGGVCVTDSVIESKEEEETELIVVKTEDQMYILSNLIFKIITLNLPKNHLNRSYSWTKVTGEEKDYRSK